MADEVFTLAGLCQAIEQQIQAALPGARTVAFWPSIRDRIALPAVLLEFSDVEPGTEIGTGETSLVLQVEARIVLAPEQPHHQLQAAHLAGLLAVLLRAQTWGLAVEPAEFVQAGVDYTKPDLDSYYVWQVQWRQQVYLGEETWPWPQTEVELVLDEDNPGSVEPEVP